MPRLTKSELEARLEGLLDEVVRLRLALDERDRESRSRPVQPAATTDLLNGGRQPERRTRERAWNEFCNMLARYRVDAQMRADEEQPL